MKRIEWYLKNFLLKLLVLFNPVEKQLQNPVFTSNSNLLYQVKSDWDALVTTPLLFEIKKAIGCHIFVLADKKNHFVFRNNPSIDEVIIYSKGLKGFFSINQIIKDRAIDAVVDLHDDVSTTVSYLIALAKTKYKTRIKKI